MDDIMKQIQKIADKAKQEVEADVSFEELFNSSFMKEHTKFHNVDDFFEQSPFEINSSDDFDALSEDELDKYISESTNFSSWQDFKEAAGREYALRKLKKLDLMLNSEWASLRRCFLLYPNKQIARKR